MGSQQEQITLGGSVMGPLNRFNNQRKLAREFHPPNITLVSNPLSTNVNFPIHHIWVKAMMTVIFVFFRVGIS